MKRNIVVTELATAPVAEQEVEIVERKGVGHPDSICDALAEASALALSKRYLAACGRVLHFNVDKALLVSGRAEVVFGGGRLLEPMTFILGGQATHEWQGHRFPVLELAAAAGGEWLRRHLRLPSPSHDVVFRDETRPGSAELVEIYAQQTPVANDTSVGVGYAPLSPTEALTLDLERYINDSEFKRAFPAAGEDVKVMAVRRGRDLALTVAMPLISRFIADEQDYFARRAELRGAIETFVRGKLPAQMASLQLALNPLDTPGQGLAGVYLSLTGTSAESGDAGQVGRGNRLNGVIAFNRPVTLEAIAGKNPVAHVGKIYTLLSFKLADEIQASVAGIREVYVRLCSRIGSPVDQPLIAEAQLVLQPGVRLGSVEGKVRVIVDRRLAEITSFTHRLARGEEDR